MEMLPAQRQAFICAVFFNYDSSITYLFTTLYFRYISKDWFWLASIGYCF